MTEVCKICGLHKATRVKTDKNSTVLCPHCGYCGRWHPQLVDGYIHGIRLFRRWRLEKQQQIVNLISHRYSTTREE